MLACLVGGLGASVHRGRDACNDEKQEGIVAKSPDSGAREPGVLSWVCSLLVV